MWVGERQKECVRASGMDTHWQQPGKLWPCMQTTGDATLLNICAHIHTSSRTFHDNDVCHGAIGSKIILHVLLGCVRRQTTDKDLAVRATTISQRKEEAHSAESRWDNIPGREGGVMAKVFFRAMISSVIEFRLQHSDIPSNALFTRITGEYFE